MIYYLSTCIYHESSTLVKTINAPREEKKGRFSKRQDAYTKNVERVFGMLNLGGLLLGTVLTWNVGTMREVMTTCVIMHNMTVDDERDEGFLDQGRQFQGELVAPQAGPSTFEYH
jgi:hypothetical protein